MLHQGFRRPACPRLRVPRGLKETQTGVMPGAGERVTMGGPCSVGVSDAPGPLREGHHPNCRRLRSILQPKNERWAVGKPRSMCYGARLSGKAL